MKKNTHVVIKIEDIEKYLTREEIGYLNAFLIQIQQGRQKDGKKPINDYYICNTDEPYSEEVYSVILRGEKNADCN